MFCSHNGLQFPTRPSRKKCLKRDGLWGRIYGLMHTASSLYMHGPPWKSNVAEGRRSYRGWCDENRKSAAAALSLTAMLMSISGTRLFRVFDLRIENYAT